MKCPMCWADKAYRREVKGAYGLALACLLLVPMRCHHCFHRFVISRLATWGQQILPPTKRPSSSSAETSQGSSSQRRRVA